MTGSLRYRILDGFLSKNECRALIKMARPRLQPSEGWAVTSGRSEATTYRVSDQVWFHKGEQHPLITSIEEKLAKETGFGIEKGEDLQVVRYKQGGHYYMHHDGFDPNYEGNKAVLNRGGQRIMTCLIYLSDLKQDGSEGGATYFPALDMRVYPKAGRALIWWNITDDGTKTKRLEPAASHAGEDLLSSKKEKWIATKWYRESTFY